MEDGAPAHRAVSTRKWLDDQGVKRFEGWPGNSPDLNIIENIWSQMKHEQRREQAMSMTGLKKNRMKGLEEPKAGLCGKALRVTSKADASSRFGGRRSHQVLIDSKT